MKLGALYVTVKQHKETVLPMSWKWEGLRVGRDVEEWTSILSCYEQGDL